MLGWLILGAGACWLIYHVWDTYVRPAPGDGRGGFLDFLKHPDRFGGLDLQACPGNAFPLPDAEDDAAWDLAMRDAIGRQWDTFEYVRLASRHPRIPPAALRLLADGDFLSRAWPRRKQALPAWNLSAVEKLLPEVVPAEALPHLERLLSHPDEWFRNSAAQIVGRVDDPRAAPLIRKLLDGEDRRMRDAVTGAMARVVHGRTGDGELIRDLWEDLYRAMAADRVSYDGMPTIVSRMIAADPERGRRLADPTFLRWDLGELRYALEGLRRAGVAPAREHVVHLLRTWRAIAPSKEHSAYHRAGIIGECLLLLSADAEDAHRAETSALVDSLLADADPDVRRQAAPALLAFHHITDTPRDTCYRIVYETKGILSQAQSDLWELTLLMDEVLNGGWHQYFVNGSGDGWRRCLAACERTGLPTVAADLKQAAAVFGPEGPDTDRTRRHRQLASLTKHQDAILEGLGFDESAVTVALARHAVAHRSDFV